MRERASESKREKQRLCVVVCVCKRESARERKGEREGVWEHIHTADIAQELSVSLSLFSMCVCVSLSCRGHQCLKNWVGEREIEKK